MQYGKMCNNSNDVDYEKEYTPSLHIRRFNECPNPQTNVIQNFIEIGQSATIEALSKYKSRLNIRYGGTDDNQLLDIFYKDHEFDKPIFIYIHGGFWTDLDKSSSGVCVSLLLSQGYKVILLDYNLCPQVTLKKLCEQVVENFFQWLQKYTLDTRTTEIAICGHSAGAHLACQIFQKNLHFEKLNVDKFFLISGIYDLRELWTLKCCNNNNILNLNGLSATQLSPSCWNYSKKIISWLNYHRAQIYLLVGEFDSETFKKQSETYSELLRSLGLQTHYRIFENYDHFNIIEDIVNLNSPISLYIKDKLNTVYNN